jgi:hypothetical protein
LNPFSIFLYFNKYHTLLFIACPLILVNEMTYILLLPYKLIIECRSAEKDYPF